MKTKASSDSAHLETLHRRISAIRSKSLTVQIATGLALAVTTVVCGLTGEMLLDWLAKLPWIARACALAGWLAGAGWFVWMYVVIPLRKRRSDDEVALMIERELRAFRSRFIASIQLARAAGKDKPSPLVSSLLAETAELATKVKYHAVVNTDRMRRKLGIALGVICIAVGLGWLGGGATPLLFMRAFLSTAELPLNTRILSVTGGKTIGMGEDFLVEITAEGVLPAMGQIIATTATGERREFPVEPLPDAQGKYTAIVRSPQESFAYYVRLNDATTAKFEIKVLPRPAVADVTCVQTFPSYLSRPPAPRSTGELNMLAGSRLKVRVKSSMPARGGSLELAGPGTLIPLQVDASDSSYLEGEILIPATGLTGFSVQLTNVEGVDSGPSALYPIQIVPDRTPKISVVRPVRREELATSQASMLVAFEARDDFGVSKVQLHYKLDEEPEKTIEFELTEGGGVSVSRRFDWKLSSLNPRPKAGSVIEFHMIAVDNNTETGPGEGTSEVFQIRVVSDEEKRLDLANRFSDAMGGIDEMKVSQEELNKSLGEIILAKPQPPQEQP